MTSLIIGQAWTLAPSSFAFRSMASQESACAACIPWATAGAIPVNSVGNGSSWGSLVNA